jgi:hypothetical protein
VVRHCGLFKGTAILKVGGDPGRPEAVIAELGRDAESSRSIRLRQHGASEPAGATADRAEQRPLWIVAQSGLRRNINALEQRRCFARVSDDRRAGYMTCKSYRAWSRID